MTFEKQDFSNLKTENDLKLSMDGAICFIFYIHFFQFHRVRNFGLTVTIFFQEVHCILEKYNTIEFKSDK